MNSTHIFFSNLNSYAAYIRISIWLKHKASPRKFSSIKQSMMEALDNAHFFHLIIFYFYETFFYYLLGRKKAIKQSMMEV